ncbi:hypothetical protein ACH4HG_28730 [Streptomyces coeruleorubidus]|uniref:hypothetical protein n=1 Tax=Streptomyces coeruleorubidus TaxID=116188 RepID=UPI0018770E37|nr:hypothetical protein [Streptomyces bellus]GGU27625.1 hypothetical protein GCM10010244_62720 [Streptomyces bellus]
MSGTALLGEVTMRVPLVRPSALMYSEIARVLWKFNALYIRAQDAPSRRTTG